MGPAVRPPSNRIMTGGTSLPTTSDKRQIGARMATFVLVHGGGHGGWCYQPVARILRAAGHDVYAPTMSGLGERSHLVNPAIDLDTHIRDIAAVMYYEDLRDVTLVGHSYGGMVITGAADRARS